MTDVKPNNSYSSTELLNLASIRWLT